jgi:hypothetical protein
MPKKKGSIRLHVPTKYATDTGRQFEPETETHHFGFVVKVVDPGCTLEIQIEERSGQVTRITTTDEPHADVEVITAAVLDALKRMVQDFQLN